MQDQTQDPSSPPCEEPEASLSVCLSELDRLRLVSAQNALQWRQAEHEALVRQQETLRLQGEITARKLAEVQKQGLLAAEAFNGVRLEINARYKLQDQDAVVLETGQIERHVLPKAP